MADSWYTSKQDSVLAPAAVNYATRLATGYTALNVPQAMSTQFATLNTAYQASLVAITPTSRSKSLLIVRDAARKAMVAQAALVGRLIMGQPTVSDQAKADLGLNVRKTPAPRPAPGTPDNFTSSVSINGVLTTKWKCDNKGVGGTQYMVYRAINDTQDFAFLGGVGDKKFVDDTIPAAATSVTYQVQATRSTGVSDFGEFRVQLAGAVGGATQAKARDASAAAVKLAA